MDLLIKICTCFLKQQDVNFSPIVLKPRPTISNTEIDEKVRDELTNIKDNMKYANTDDNNEKIFYQ